MSDKKVRMKSIKTTTAPDGLVYVPDFITSDEEQSLLQCVEALQFEKVVMHGVEARRRVVHFGFDYGYDSWQIEPTAEIPDWLLPFRNKAALRLGLNPEKMIQVLIAQYPPGATIGWHRDAPMFGPEVIGLSLGSTGFMKFRRKADTYYDVYERALEPRSLYLIGGISRSVWQHSMVPVERLRYSITFRSVKRGYLERYGKTDVLA